MGRLYDSRLGFSEFTIARPHSLFEGVKLPAPCLITANYSGEEDEFDFLDGPDDNDRHLYFGVISSLSGVTTLESRIEVRRSVQIRPHTEDELLQLLSSKRHAGALRKRLKTQDSIMPLPPKLGIHVIERLASIRKNTGHCGRWPSRCHRRRDTRGVAAVQEDAVRTALRAIGLSPDDRALCLDLVKGRDTALARVGFMEDSVIEHDARSVPGYDLMESHLTGRAVFVSGNDRL